MRPTRLDLVFMNFMNELRDAVSVNAIGDALWRFSDQLGFEQLTIVRGCKPPTFAGSTAVYSRAAHGAHDPPDARHAMQVFEILKFALKTDRPMVLDEMRKELDILDDEWNRLRTSSTGRIDGLIVPMTAKVNDVWHFLFVDRVTQINEMMRSVLQVATAIAVVGLDEGPRAKAEPPLPLSTREYETMRLMCAGKTDAEIALDLRISPRTVRYHVDNAKRRLGVSSRVAAIVRLLHKSFVP